MPERDPLFDLTFFFGVLEFSFCLCSLLSVVAVFCFLLSVVLLSAFVLFSVLAVFVVLFLLFSVGVLCSGRLPAARWRGGGAELGSETSTKKVK